MTLYAAAEMSAVDSVSGTPTETTGTGRFEGSFGIRSAFAIGIVATDRIALENLGAFTTFWHRFFYYSGTSTGRSGRTLAEYCNNAGTPVFRLQFTSTTDLQAQYWNGSAWTNIGSAVSIAVDGLVRPFDLKIVCGGSGSFELYRDGTTLVASGSASMTAVTDIDEIRHYSTNSNNPLSTTVAEIIWGDGPTIGHRYAIAAPTGNGTDTAGSGAFGDVDEAVTDDGDFTTLTSNGDAETFTHGTMTLPSGTVKAVQVEMRVKSNAGGAQNVKARLRIGGTAYDQASNYSGIGVAYSGYRAHWATNPAGGAWTQATASQTSNEFGALAQT